MIVKFIPYLDIPFVDPSLETGFPLTVIAILPYLLYRYDDPTVMCIQASQYIASVSND